MKIIKDEKLAFERLKKVYNQYSDLALVDFEGKDLQLSYKTFREILKLEHRTPKKPTNKVVEDA